MHDPLTRPRLLHIGLTGQGDAFQGFLDFFRCCDAASDLPWLRLTAAAPSSPQARDQARAVLPVLPLYPDPETLLAAHPETEVLFACADTDAAFPDTHSGQAQVVPPRAARGFLELLRAERGKTCCETDLLQTRSLYKTILDEVEEDVILFDLNGRIVDMNRNVFSRKGKRKEDLLGLSCWEVEDPDFCCQRKEGACPYSETLASRKKAEGVHSYVDADGRMRYFRVYAYPIFDQARQMTHIMEFRRDITNRTRLEHLLQQSEKMAVLGELSTYIAHEIRNPLFAIAGFANALLRSPSLDASAKEKATIILEESKRLDNILKSTLNFARPTKAREGVVDINEVAASTMELLALGAKALGIETRFEPAANLARVAGDPELVKQCLINLVKNAQEAMEQGGRLTVRTAMTQNSVLLEVADTGPGIAPEIREKLFNPFFSTKDKGSGLGLAMTKKIIEDMGGTVDVQSQAGQGARVVLALPPVLAEDEKVA